MKRYIFVVLIISHFCVFPVVSQDWFAGGSISIGYDTSRYTGYNGSISIGISPVLGYKINNKFGIGINPLYQYQKYLGSGSIGETSILGLGLFTHYNLIEIAKFSVIADFEIRHSVEIRTVGERISYSSGGSVISKEIIKENTHRSGVSIMPVFQYKMMDWLLLYTNIGGLFYTHTWPGGYDNESDNVNFNIGTGLSLGFYILF